MRNAFQGLMARCREAAQPSPRLAEVSPDAPATAGGDETGQDPRIGAFGLWCYETTDENGQVVERACGWTCGLG